MAGHTCPVWVGYLLINPLRKLLENPDRILGGFVRRGMTVLEPGCGMGYFTLPLARMVGPEGRVVAVDIQEKMMSKLNKRAQRAGLSERIETRPVGSESLGLEDLAGKVDFVPAIHVVHEMPDQASFFSDIIRLLKPGGKLLVIEPKGHVSRKTFEQTMAEAGAAGFHAEADYGKKGGRRALFTKPSP